MSLSPDMLTEIDRILDQYIRVHGEIGAVWKNQMVFTWYWWLGLALTVLPWVTWLIVRDRKASFSLICGGFFIMLIASLLDMLGVSQGGWHYNSLLLPFFPQYLPWDLTVFPVTAMLFYQYFPRVKPWIKGAVFSAVAAFGIEPFFIWLGIYKLKGWNSCYSLPIYFAIYMVGSWLYLHSFRASKKAAESYLDGVIRFEI